jgi:hypothetical protein
MPTRLIQHYHFREKGRMSTRLIQHYHVRVATPMGLTTGCCKMPRTLHTKLQVYVPIEHASSVVDVSRLVAAPGSDQGSCSRSVIPVSD